MNKHYAQLTERMKQLPVDPYQRMVNQMGSVYANRVVAQQRAAEAEEKVQENIENLKQELEAEQEANQALEEAIAVAEGSEVIL